MPATRYHRSRWNISARAHGGGHVLYNLGTGSLIEIEDADFPSFAPLLGEGELPSDDGALSSLAELGFVVPAGVDERAELQRKHRDALRDTSHLGVALALTLNCDFRCRYCYQARQPERMTQEVWDRVLAMISRKVRDEGARSVAVDWIGGEPLLAADSLVRWQRALRDQCEAQGVELQASLSTNGYRLAGDVPARLAEAGIRRFEVTLAGHAEHHNRLRPHNANGDSYQRVLSNLRALGEDMELMLSIDLSRDNLDSARRILDDLEEQPIRARYAITPNRIEHYDINPCKEIELELSEYMRAFFALCHEILDRGLRLANNSRFGISDYTYCSAASAGSFLVDWRGNTYKCAEFGRECEQAMGEIEESGAIRQDAAALKKWEWDPFAEEPCASCPILVYCYGGCSQKRRRGADFCPEEKDFMEPMLQLYHRWLLARQAR